MKIRSHDFTERETFPNNAAKVMKQLQKKWCSSSTYTVLKKITHGNEREEN